MVESKYTTLWKGWGIRPDGYGGGYNHGWSGEALTLMVQYMVGIAPLSPGFDSYQVVPQMELLI